MRGGVRIGGGTWEGKGEVKRERYVRVESKEKWWSEEGKWKQGLEDCCAAVFMDTFLLPITFSYTFFISPHFSYFSTLPNHISYRLPLQEETYGHAYAHRARTSQRGWYSSILYVGSLMGEGNIAAARSSFCINLVAL